MGIDKAAVNRLLDRARREVDEGLLPSTQIALGYEGELVAFETYGDATPDTRYVIFSATKPFVASVMWQLIAEGEVDIAKPVTEYFPEFGANGKEAITVEQVMLHVSGFPHVPLGPRLWAERATRKQTMANWRLNWEPGTRYEYHATSAHWVLAEIIDTVTGNDYRDELERRVTGPLGLGRLLGIAKDRRENIAVLEPVGELATPDEIKAVFGVESLPVTEVTTDLLIAFNDPDAQAVGVPGGGGIARADQLALFYQELLHNKAGLWPADAARRRDRQRAQHPARPDGHPGQPGAGGDPCRRRRQGEPAGHGPQRLAPGVRAQRRRRPARLGGPRHRPVARLLHQRRGPARGARAQRGTAIASLAGSCATV